MLSHFFNRFKFQINHKANQPYYIFSPPYRNISSGVRVLHQLCHALNESGQKAYMYPDNPQGYATHPGLHTPVIQERAAEHNFYKNNNIEAIAVYPDTMKGNPLGVKRVVRYLLAPVGEYGGDKTFPSTDMVWGYTTPVAKTAGSDKVLCIPTFDPDIYFTKDSKRSGKCFYSFKYDKVCRNQLLALTDGAVRLQGSPERIASILQHSEVCYVYEMSEVIVTAQMCGCPVVLVKTPYFNHINSELEFDLNECKWSDGEKVVTKDTYHHELNYNFLQQLDNFIKETQDDNYKARS